MSTGPGQQPQVHQQGAQATVWLVVLGDIGCTQTHVVTPSGTVPIKGATWTSTDMSVTSTGIPVWAIVMAILFAVFCLLGLLFLLAKEEKTSGYVQVIVQGDGFMHTTQIPVGSRAQVADVHARVNFARSLSI